MSQPQASAALIAQGFSSRVVLPTYAEKGKPLIVAEAPGKREDEEGVVLHPEADAGGLFTRLLQRIGVERERFTLTNCVWQRPPQNELYDAEGNPMRYTQEAIAYWKPFLHEFIQEMQPPVIIGLGRTALEVLTGFTDIGTTRGYVHWAGISVRYEHGDPLEDTYSVAYERTDMSIPFTCTYHPQFLNYGQKHLCGVWLRDVLAGLEIGEKGWHSPHLKVVPTPSVDEFKWFCSQFNPERHILTYDIENPQTRGLDEDAIEAEFGKKEISYEIDRMSFCYDAAIGGWSVPFTEPFVSMARNLVAAASVLRGHNCRLHDRPRLMAHGFSFKAQEQDTLELWRHLYRTLPASVAYIAPFYLSCSPWKHEAHTQPEWYSAMDAIVQHHIGEGIERELRATGQWEVAQRHVIRILELCEQMGKNGLPYSRDKAREFEKELVGKQTTKTVRLQEITPLEVRKTKKFKTLNPQLRKWFKAHGTEPKHWVEHPEAGLVELYATRYQEPHEGEWYRYQLNGCWQKVYDFNPNSHIQKKALIRYFKHKLKTNRKTKKETSDDNTLKSLITTYIESDKPQDRVAVECYQLIRECVAISKVLGTYVRGWRPGSDGLIHSTPGIWGDMFRISWRDPNLAATVADKKEVQIAAGFRKCIASSKGEVLVECDWKGMEAQLVAYFAGDKEYARVSKMSANAYLASHILDRPADLAWSDADLKAYLKEIRDDPRNTKVYDDAKHTNFLITYGGTAYLMAEMYEMTRQRAKWLLDLFFSLFPKVKQWQQRVIQEAHERARLVNAWGYRMPIFDAYTWNQKRYDTLRDTWVKLCTTMRHRPDGGVINCSTKHMALLIKKVTELVQQGVGEDQAIRDLCYDLGTEAKAALSFYPRDSGAAMLKDVVLAAEDEHRLVSSGAIRALAHDAVLSVVPYEKADEVAEQVVGLQERPVTRLDGLVIESEAKFGMCWDKAGMKGRLMDLTPMEVVAV